VKVISQLRTWWQHQTGEEDTPFDGDSSAFVTSLVVHLCLLVALGFVPLYLPEPQLMLTLTAPVEEELETELTLPEEFTFSDEVTEEIGANSFNGEQMAFSEAPIVADVSNVPTPTELAQAEFSEIHVNEAIDLATGLHMNENMTVKGAAGHGTTGAAGAIDQLTNEILLSLEERKTLVVWLFDQSGSLERQRAAILDRFDRIYEELGVIQASGNEAFAKHEDKPLLTSIVAFGNAVNLKTKEPTDSMEDIKEAVRSIEQDTTGVERVFSATYKAAKEYAKYRITTSSKSKPERNVMLVVVSDEVGDDQTGMEDTIKMCRRYEMPVFVVGVPAPFGRNETLVKWVDPNPEFDQAPQWGVVSQGPESFLPERVKLGFFGQKDKDPMIDSGFGPFALTRLAYETGGIYFAVHPNRNVRKTVSRRDTAAFSAHLQHFFDPQVMRRYRPDYVSAQEYDRRVRSSKARMALINAAKISRVGQMDSPKLEFVKSSEAEMVNELSEAQKDAAKLEPKLIALHEMLKLGEADRNKEASPRWQAGFDLAMGRVIAVRTRTETYNAMLAKAKRGLKFEDEKNNTWVLTPADDVSTGSQLKKAADKARVYLERVVKDHEGTPWALLAKKELETPIGWKWVEKFTEIAPRNGGGGGGNNNPANDARRMIKKGPKRRPIPKL